MLAAQRRRRALDDLMKNTPADGLVAGIGRVNGDLFEDSRAHCVAMSYDYTVLAGTQGQQNHRKKDRMFEIAAKQRLPVVFFTEGGGGRPGDTDGLWLSGLDVPAFHYWGKLSGLVPMVGINSGRCFAGNAALLGCCDVVIATANSNIGMGGPAMVEGGGLGIFRPEEIGPMSVQVRQRRGRPRGRRRGRGGARREKISLLLPGLNWPMGMRRSAPAARNHPGESPAHLRRPRGDRDARRHRLGARTAPPLRAGDGDRAGRIEGRPLGVIANNPTHLAGAIDSDGADKAARFMQLCDAFDLPLLFLCDTPGIMVGPEIEKTALVRHAARMFIVGANISVPFFTIVLRKGYGLGAQAMAGGSFKTPIFTVSWPTGEFGGMGLEGAAKLGYRKELEAVDEPGARKKLFEEMVARMYQQGKALNSASHFELDDVIDPVESRRWILTGLRSAPPPAPRTGKKRPHVDSW